MSKSEIIHVLVKNRKETLFEGPAKSVSSFNEKGVFDILPSHANFISLIKDRIYIVKENDELVDLQINSGVLRVSLDAVEIYLDISDVTKAKPKNRSTKKEEGKV